MAIVKKIISYQDAKDIVNQETDLDALLLEIKKKNPNGTEFSNDAFFKVEKPYGTIRNDKKGTKLPTICPFHNTKSNDSTSILKGEVDVVYCFTGGCVANKAITATTAVMILELGVNPKLIGTPASYNDYRKAVYRLAARLGYTIQNKKRRLSIEQKRQMTREEILLKSAEIYHEEFMNSKEAQNYFIVERGFQYGVVDAWEIIKKFKIGFAPNVFPSDFLYKKLAPDFTTEEMIDASVVKWIQFKDSSGKVIEEKPVDFHSHAVVMPYWKHNYRVVTNIYSRGVDAPKKWRHLRLAGSVDEPIHFEEAIRYPEVHLVEGEMSLLSMLALDYPNTMGNRGTNGLSDEHVELLVKAREESNGEHCKRIVLCFDGDEAGQKATITTGEKLLERGFEVVVMMLKKDEDPNDILQNKKENAKSYIDKIKAESVSYYTFIALSKMTNNTIDTADTLKEFHDIKNTLAQHGVTSELELRLVAREFADIKRIPFEAVWQVWEKKNKETDVLINQNFAFMTNNYDAFVLTRHVFPGKTAYVEDVTFSFLAETPIVRSLIIDDESYDEEEKILISNFAKEHGIRLFPIGDFDKIIDMNQKELMNRLLKS